MIVMKISNSEQWAVWDDNCRTILFRGNQDDCRKWTPLRELPQITKAEYDYHHSKIGKRLMELAIFYSGGELSQAPWRGTKQGTTRNGIVRVGGPELGGDYETLLARLESAASGLRLVADDSPRVYVANSYSTYGHGSGAGESAFDSLVDNANEFTAD